MEERPEFLVPFSHLLGLTRSDRVYIGFNGKWSEPITIERTKERGPNQTFGSKK